MTNFLRFWRSVGRLALGLMFITIIAYQLVDRQLAIDFAKHTFSTKIDWDNYIALSIALVAISAIGLLLLYLSSNLLFIFLTNVLSTVRHRKIIPAAFLSDLELLRNIHDNSGQSLCRFSLQRSLSYPSNIDKRKIIEKHSAGSEAVVSSIIRKGIADTVALQGAYTQDRAMLQTLANEVDEMKFFLVLSVALFLMYASMWTLLAVMCFFLVLTAAISVKRVAWGAFVICLLHEGLTVAEINPAYPDRDTSSY